MDNDIYVRGDVLGDVEGGESGNGGRKPWRRLRINLVSMRRIAEQLSVLCFAAIAVEFFFVNAVNSRQVIIALVVSIGIMLVGIVELRNKP